MFAMTSGCCLAGCLRLRAVLTLCALHRSLLKARDLVKAGDLVIVVSDIRPENQDVVRSAQIRKVPAD